ncbi:hypothetical protein BAE44_0021899 [Dichanthelium oligosanthes]|uniref:Phorbol-ester/DAG-type domain-containing protein n=1 Tax=Dichanthelium oligosanthes TaxID=888268 RepID=A0A1E5UVX1_9POAL|nr:hypothetical protein BAE44_0021899 [Dichanthelium oligosanthes]
MASNPPRHFDPYHPLVNTEYSHDQPGLCNICLLRLAGHKGYGCHSCNIHLHSACTSYFGETISFFAHPSHTLKLSRSPGRICNICRGDCPQGSFVYRCLDCGFDLHPLCSILPERVRSPFHPDHELCMVSSELGCCSACRHPLPMWRYVCSSHELHITCAIDLPTAAGGQGSNGPAAFQSIYAGAQGSGGAAGQRSLGGSADQRWYPGPVTPGYNYAIPYFGGPVFQGGYGHYSYAPVMPGGYDATGSSGQSILHNPTRLMTAVAKFLFSIAISTTVSDLASQLLSGGFN